MEKHNLKNIKTPRIIRVYYSTKWIAERVDKPEEIMKWKFKNDKLNSLSVAEVIRKHIPLITSDILDGKNDIRIFDNGKLILATHPRPHQEWKYDFLKSYICVVGPIEKEQEIIKKFEKEKRNAERRKKKAQRYINKIKPTLNTLVKKRLVDGILGRGSFFGSNGYPTKKDDIDFILLINKLKKETEEKIIRILKQIPKFSVTLVRRNDEIIKKGKLPEISFVIVTREMVSHGLGIEYERYVLRNGVGIKLNNLSINKSEKLAKTFISLLPNKKQRNHLSRLPPKK
jgi:hypothetical protein